MGRAPGLCGAASQAFVLPASNHTDMGKHISQNSPGSDAKGDQKKTSLVIFTWVVLIMAGVLLALAGVLMVKWPFTRAGIIRRLERASSAHVEIERFRSTWFPYPGCVAEGVVFRKPASNQASTSNGVVLNHAALNSAASNKAASNKAASNKASTSNGPAANHAALNNAALNNAALNSAASNGTSRAEASAPMLTIEKLSIQSTYSGLLSRTKRIKEIIAEGARIHLQRGGAGAGEAGLNSSPAGAEGEKLVIEELRVENAVLEIVSGDARQTTFGAQQRTVSGSAQKAGSDSQQKGASGGQGPLTFQIHRAIFRNLSRENTVPFEVSVRTPVPPGEVQVGGWIGPAKGQQGSFRSTPISGFYTLQGADLGVFHSLGGHVSSRGEFSGTLERLNVAGSTESPDFEVTASRHRFHLSTQFRGVLDLKSGDLVLPSLTARFGNTSLGAHARIFGTPKTVELNVVRGKGEIQDLILLFSKAPQAAVTGPVSFQAVAVLPPERRPFKQRVQLTGDFVIDPAHFSSPNTQEHVDQLSERAQGKKDKHKDYDSDDDALGFESVITNLRGRVALKNGVATFSEITFRVPGAEADMNGTYSLVNKKVDLKGKMRMQATVSQATTGAKSLFLKVLDPMFKKKGAGAEVNVAMTGTYGHAHFKAGLK
jgi:hypothetical protein